MPDRLIGAKAARQKISQRGGMIATTRAQKDAMSRSGPRTTRRFAEQPPAQPAAGELGAQTHLYYFHALKRTTEQLRKPNRRLPLVTKECDELGRLHPRTPASVVPAQPVAPTPTSADSQIQLAIELPIRPRRTPQTELRIRALSYAERLGRQHFQVAHLDGHGRRLP